MKDVADSNRSVTTLVDLLRWRAVNQPEQLGYTFLTDGDDEESHLTYAELDRRARRIAATIHSIGANGRAVLLVFPSGLDFIAAFFGCLYAGSTAIAANPPRPNRTSERLRMLVENSGACAVLTLENIRAQMEAELDETKRGEGIVVVATDEVDAADEARWEAPQINSDSIALLQYTSGSTAAPKGTIISHGNILHNSQLIEHAFEHTASSVVVGWLPMTHDMGLIGNLLQPLYVGCRCILLSPEHFLVRPIRWLRAISKYRATTSGGPNFAYDYCAQKIKPEYRDELDLGSWDLAFSGAESVRAETIARFSDAFAQCGFKRSAFYPCYGLAEATLIVTGGSKSHPPVEKTLDIDALAEKRVVPEKSAAKRSRAIIGCGRPLLNQQVVIVNADTGKRCSDDEIGEIWISGPSVARGYWQQTQETDRTFGGRLAECEEVSYLRSGDLGFFHDGELFISGRLKDIIIIGGSNHFPVDIELTVENCHPALRPHCVAAVSVDVDGAEKLVVVAEVLRHFLVEAQHDDIDNITAAIREAVSRQHDLSAHAVCLVKQSSIPKTPNGKMQRHRCRSRFLAGELALVTV